MVGVALADRSYPGMLQAVPWAPFPIHPGSPQQHPRVPHATAGVPASPRCAGKTGRDACGVTGSARGLSLVVLRLAAVWDGTGRRVGWSPGKW